MKWLHMLMIVVVMASWAAGYLYTMVALVMGLGLMVSFASYFFGRKQKFTEEDWNKRVSFIIAFGLTVAVVVSGILGGIVVFAAGVALALVVYKVASRDCVIHKEEPR